MFNKIISNHIILIFISLIIFHFIPFERSSLAPDDYSLINIRNGIDNFIIHPDRPLLYIFLELLYSIFSENINLYFYLLITTNFLNLIIVYHLYKLFFNPAQSFLLTLIYLVLYLKLEIYHNSIMIHISIVCSLYLLFLYTFIIYINNKKIIYYFLSIILYFICIFWYEIGFFLPFVVLFYKSKNIKSNYKNKIINLIPYISLMICYILLRQTSLFGLSQFENSYEANFNIFIGLYDIFNHLFGRYALKNILYGFYQFFNFDVLYFIFFIIFNLIFCIFIFKKFTFEKLKNNNLIFFITLFLLSILPILINGESGGRNYIIISVSISFFIYLLFQYRIFNLKFIYIGFIFSMFIVSQGNSISQVIASRIQNEILNSINHNVNNTNYDTIVFDPISLTQNIKYSFFRTNYNLINTYYGAQVWEVWGLKSYIRSLNSNKNLIIVNKNPSIQDGMIVLSEIVNIKNNSVHSNPIKLLNNNNIILDFDQIYYLGYEYGKNE